MTQHIALAKMQLERSGSWAEAGRKTKECKIINGKGGGVPPSMYLTFVVQISICLESGGPVE